MSSWPKRIFLRDYFLFPKTKSPLSLFLFYMMLVHGTIWAHFISLFPVKSGLSSTVWITHHHHHHHHVVLSAWIFLSLSHHPSQSFIALGRSSGLHPVSAQSCCIYVQTGRPAFARPCEGVHSSTSLTSLSLLL